MDGYDKLNLIDKIRFRWKVRQQEKSEDKRQALEHDDRIPVDKQGIEQYKVPNNTIKSPSEILMEQDQKRLDLMLGKELTSEREAYDNIIELQAFLEYPHDNLPDAENKVYEKLYYIQTILGKDILDKGLQIYKNDKMFRDTYTVMSLQDRMNLEQEILNNPKLAEQLADLRYNPEKVKNRTGKVFHYLAVYSKMAEKANENDYDRKNSETSSDLGEK